MKVIPIRAGYLSNLPIFISFVLAAVWVWYNHALTESTALFLGIIAGGLVDLDDRFTGRLRNIFFTLIHFSLASIAVQLTFAHPWLFALLMVVAAFSSTMAGAIDVRYRTIAFGTLLVMLYTVLTYMPSVAWYINPIMLICGTVLYSVCTITMHMLFPHRPVQENLAMAYHNLADYMRVKAQFFDPDETDFLDKKEVRLAMNNTAVVNTFNLCRSALFYRLRSQYRHRRTERLLQDYFVAQDIHERISSRYVEYREFADKLAHSDLIYRIQRLIVLQAEACQSMAEALRDNRDFVPDDILMRAGQGLRKAAHVYSQTHPQEVDALYLQRLLDNVLSISDQLARLGNIQQNSSDEQSELNRIAGQDVDRIRDILPALRRHWGLNSSVFRHAVRMAIMTVICCLIVESLHLKMGYWILLTALLVCQPNHSATTTRLKQRIGGTLLGVLVGSVLPYFTPTLAGKLLIVVAGATSFFIFRTRRYSFSTFFITIQVLAGFAIIGMDTMSMMLYRFIDTILGSAIAWVTVSYLWPDWHYLTLGKTAANALQGDADYLQQVLCQLQSQYADNVEYRSARRVAHERAVLLSNVVSDMSTEPKKYSNRLPEALNLLQLNYAFISNISALGAFRTQMDGLQQEKLSNKMFLQNFFEAGRQMVILMKQNDTNQDFAASLTELRRVLTTCRPGEDDTNIARHVLWSQLNRISERLPLYHNTLQKQ